MFLIRKQVGDHEVITAEQINSSVTVKAILAFCWAYYVAIHNIRAVEAKEVKKAIACYDHHNGCFVYVCACCKKYTLQSLGCNARICSGCGKRYADAWAMQLSRRMFKVPHRHIVLSIASELWPYLRKDRTLWKTYMDSAIDTLNDYLPKAMHHKKLTVGAIVILHPFGKDMKFQPHLHLIITEGCFDEKKNWIARDYFYAEGLAKCWKYHICKNLSAAGVPFEVTNWCYKNKRFYVWVHKDGKITHPKLIARYLGRYVRHPAIANSRIDWFDKTTLRVGFHYENHNKIRQNIIMSTDEFITALIQHIPEPQFKMIRYYGAYARHTRKSYKMYLQSSIEQKTLLMYGVKKPEKILFCPYCSGTLDFVIVLKKPPPENIKSQEELVDWISANSLSLRER